MITTIVDVYVKEEFIEDFIKASEKNHKGSTAEAENLRFDIIQSEDNPCHFVLYEAYVSQAGVTAHKETAHYAEWRDTVEPMMQKPRSGTKYKMHYPSSQADT